MSLGKPFYATWYSIYTCTERSYWKIEEGCRRLWNKMEAYGSIWKSLENARTVHR